MILGFKDFAEFIVKGFTLGCIVGAASSLIGITVCKSLQLFNK